MNPIIPMYRIGHWSNRVARLSWSLRQQTVNMRYSTQLKDGTKQRGEHSKFKVSRENRINVPISYNQEKNPSLIYWILLPAGIWNEIKTLLHALYNKILLCDANNGISKITDIVNYLRASSVYLLTDQVIICDTTPHICEVVNFSRAIFTIWNMDTG